MKSNTASLIALLAAATSTLATPILNAGTPVKREAQATFSPVSPTTHAGACTVNINFWLSKSATSGCSGAAGQTIAITPTNGQELDFSGLTRPGPGQYLFMQYAGTVPSTSEDCLPEERSGGQVVGLYNQAFTYIGPDLDFDIGTPSKCYDLNGNSDVWAYKW